MTAAGYAFLVLSVILAGLLVYTVIRINQLGNRLREMRKTVCELENTIRQLNREKAALETRIQHEGMTNDEAVDDFNHRRTVFFDDTGQG
jgi:uncharacterized protein YoxC